MIFIRGVEYDDKSPKIICRRQYNNSQKKSVINRDFYLNELLLFVRDWYIIIIIIMSSLQNEYRPSTTHTTARVYSCLLLPTWCAIIWLWSGSFVSYIMQRSRASIIFFFAFHLYLSRNTRRCKKKENSIAITYTI